MSPRNQLIFLPQHVECIRDEFATAAQIVEDVSAQHKVASVDPDVALLRCFDPAHRALSARAQTGHDMKAVARRDAEKRRELGGIVAHVLYHLIEWGIGEVVSVVGQEHLVTLEERLDLLEALADVGMEASVDQGDVPAVDLAGKVVNVLPASGDDKVIGRQLIEAEEIVLNGGRPIAKTEDEVSETVMGIVLHDVPKDRPVPDAQHRLGDLLRDLSHAHAQAATEDDDFHF